MKRIIAGLLLLSCAVSINAAQVSFQVGQSHPSASGYQMNVTNDLEYASTEYDEYVSDFALVSPQANDGEELIYLGAYQNISYSADPAVDTINVDIQNTNSSLANTGAVSLILSGGRQVKWDLTWDTSVDLKSIILFALDEDEKHSLAINGENINLISMSSSFMDLDIKHSDIDICGVALPQGSNADCFTDKILGINSYNEDEWGEIFSSNEFLVNYLSQETHLKVTNFNGAYEADNFVVEIDTTAVPLPSAYILFLPPFCLIFGRSLVSKLKV